MKRSNKTNTSVKQSFIEQLTTTNTSKSTTTQVNKLQRELAVLSSVTMFLSFVILGLVTHVL